ncbi:TetR family transcriptional regulator [Xenorhabdus bovienii]|uniref:TetR family transcriptional regulator n=1 Tax=Xenorhabdus bovienii TaxID=40576 RepID=UPI003DA5C62B
MTDREKVGRRERKKLMLRDALIKTSYELFAIKGFDETRVEDITEKVDVSTRTFFRYFSSKEDVVFDYQEAEHKDFIAALIRRPPHEPALSALRHTAVEIMKRCEGGSYGFNTNCFMTLQDLIRNHPLIRAKNLQRGEDRKPPIISLIAQRMGTDPKIDIRPGVLAGVLDYAHWATYDVWKRKKHSSMLYSDVLDEVFLIIENGLNFPANNQPDI